MTPEQLACGEEQALERRRWMGSLQRGRGPGGWGDGEGERSRIKVVHMQGPAPPTTVSAVPHERELRLGISTRTEVGKRVQRKREGEEKVFKNRIRLC